MSHRHTAKRTAPAPKPDSLASALATIRSVAPQLYQSPDVLKELAALLIRAESIGEANGIAPPSGRSYTIKASPTSGQPLAGSFSSWGNQLRDAPQGVPNAAILRVFADKNPWVAAAITLRTQQIGRSSLACLPADERKPYNKKVQLAVTALLNTPNEYRESLRTIMERVIRDILTIDRGCISKDIDLAGIPHHIYAEDGATIRIVPDWDGDPNKPRYMYVPPGSIQQFIPLRNDQLICIMANDASYRYGLAPVQILYETIEADIQATKSAKNLVANKPPPHLINFPGASQGTIDALSNRLASDILGHRDLLLTGAEQNPQVSNLVFSLKDNQWLEWQDYLARKICAVFQVSPQQLGILQDVNRATGQVQDQEFKDNGLIPLLLLFEEYLNRELLFDFAPKGRDGMPNVEVMNLRIIYPEVSEMMRMMHAERTIIALGKAMPNTPLMTPNETRTMLGEEPFKAGGNTMWYMMSPTLGPMPWVSYDDDYGSAYADRQAAQAAAQTAATNNDGSATTGVTSPDDTTPNFNTSEPPPSQQVSTGDDANADTPAQAQTDKALKPYNVHRYDVRPAGMGWQPSQRITVRAASPDGPKATQSAREKLATRARAIFAEVGKE